MQLHNSVNIIIIKYKNTQGAINIIMKEKQKQENFKLGIPNI